MAEGLMSRVTVLDMWSVTVPHSLLSARTLT